MLKSKVNLIGLFLFSFSSFSVEIDTHWLKLMRYNKTIFGFESEVDNSAYFFAKNGKTNPQAELKATLKAFNKSSTTADINKHPICRFPGRYIYLAKKKSVPEFNLNLCTDFKKFKSKINLKSVSLMFSSYFINKPASAFGHTFIKLNQGDALNSDLKSYGIDFSAQVTTKNALMYGVMGMFGGFYGRFSLLPYFLKLREYNDYESRDLWEFELKFEKTDLDLFVAHLWDMNLALFDYYYFSENCSYHIFRFIDAIKPQWKLWSHTYSFVVPMDTLIPIVENKKILKNIYLRESIQKKVKKQLNSLSGAELRFLKKTINSKKLQPLSQIERKEMTLDALAAYIDYKYPKDIHLKKDSSWKDLKFEVLKKRSQLPGSFEKQLIKSRHESFNYAHRPRRFTLSYFKEDQIKGYEIEHRTALHNLMEYRGDAYSNFTLEMGKINLQYDLDNKKLLFNRYTLAEVYALRPISYLEKLISWNFSVGAKRDHIFQEQIGVFANLGIGYAFNLFDSVFSVFGQTHLAEIGRYRSIRDELLGLKLLWNYSYEKLSLQLDYNHFYDLESKASAINNLDASLQYRLALNHSLNFSFGEKFKNIQSKLSYILYF